MADANEKERAFCEGLVDSARLLLWRDLQDSDKEVRMLCGEREEKDSLKTARMEKKKEEEEI